MLKIKAVETHTPVFLNGKNLGTKLDSKNPGLSNMILSYDEDTKRVWVEWNGAACFLTETGIHTLHPHPKDLKGFGYKLQNELITPNSKPFAATPQVSNVSQTAQIETPMQRVQQPPSPRSLK